MAASSHWRFVRNVISGSVEPLKVLGHFQAGGTQAIKDGQIIELSGGNWIPLAGDRDLSAGVGAIAATKIEDGDRAGYYPILVPRPGDLWRFQLDASDDLALGTALYPYGTVGEQVTDTAGTNVIGNVAGDAHYPEQGHLSVDGSPDAGTTLRYQSDVIMSFQASNSYYSLLFTA
jgi:hypothetical protein